MEDHLHVAHFRQQQTLATGAEAHPLVPLRIRQRVVAPLAAKARIAWLLSSLEPTEEGVHRLLHAQRHILDNLRMHLLESWAHVSFQSGQFGFLVIIVDRLLSFFPCLLAFGQQGIPEPAQLLQLLRQQPLLALGGIQAVFE